MPRIKKCRSVESLSTIRGLYASADGLSIQDEPILLNSDEYEAIRLSDYLFLTQAQASEKMSISRPTFTRIYENARRKIAKAIVEGRSLVFENSSDRIMWRRCSICGASFSGNLKVVSNRETEDDKICPLCSMTDNIVVAATVDQYPYTQVDSNFARCSRFAVLNRGERFPVFMENRFKDLQKDAGKACAEFIKGSLIKTVVAGNFGIKAAEELSDIGVTMVIPQVRYSIIELIEKINNIKS